MPKRPDRDDYLAGDELRINPAWVAGMFEVGGYIGFSVQTSHGYPNTQPYVGIDGEQQQVEKLQKLLGGSIRFSKRSGRQRWEWRQRGRQAVELATLIEEVAPSRAEVIAAFENWVLAEDGEERLELVSELRESTRRGRNEVTTEQYRKLVKNGAFIAGVLDARACLTISEHVADSGDYVWGTPLMVVSSTNGPLLASLQQHHGGSFMLRTEKGKELEIGGKTYIAQRDSYKWFVSSGGIKSLNLFVQGHLQLVCLDQS